jgi:ankyrin repeat protein
MEAIKLLALAGVSFNCSDYDKRTPLHIAGSLGYKTIYDFLLLNKAEIYA